MCGTLRSVRGHPKGSTLPRVRWLMRMDWRSRVAGCVGRVPVEREWLLPRMSDCASDPATAGRMPVEHLVYSDGLASVSIFIEHLDANGAPRGTHHR